MNPEATDGRLLRELLHEIRTPLAALAALTPAIEDGARDTYLSILEHLSGILHRSLGCGETACGTNTETVDIEGVLDDAVRLVAAARRTSTFQVFAPGASTVRGDRVLLTQILVNLLANAARHSPAAEAVVVRVTRSGGDVLVEVRDRGEGVPVELRERVFENGESFGDHAGDGIGLSLSRRLAERMSGTIRLEDEPGGVFTLVLPAV